MYTKSQEEALEKLKAYLDRATPEQLKADREKVAEWREVGPDWKSYLENLSSTLASERRFKLKPD